MTQKTTPEQMASALEEAVRRFAELGIVVTTLEIERALMGSCGFTSPRELLEHGWTPDVIVHSVGRDQLPPTRSR